ncbi:MAG: response regulator, partial [Acetobacteraceae bacterium]
MEDFELEMHRHGFTEETHFTVAYSPVPDDTVQRGIGGVLATVHEITEKVIGERRIAALRELGTRSAEARTAEEACVAAIETLAKHPKDVPFALLYLLESGGKSARLVAATGFSCEEASSPSAVSLDDPIQDCRWPLAEAVRTEKIVTIEDLPVRSLIPPAGPWSDPPHCAVVVPVQSNTSHQLAGLLVAGVSSRLRLDEQYRSFYELAAGQIATTIANARAYEEERRRADALAEIDRAKTAFFSNISHEFRTPITLLLGPMEEAAANPITPAPIRSHLELAHRNALRLLKLVNSLLDFSRIEAGRVQASYEPTDLAALTSDLASTFRSAMERAGLRLDVQTSDLGEEVLVDREMWEKIVLNLLSNAFKFTLEGSVAVRLLRDGTDAVLEIADTGAGIPDTELPRIFERFHRVEGAVGRTQEGSGIGLALVQELVKLHAGGIAVESALGQGTTFRVRIPFGTAHLPANRIKAARSLASTAIGAHAFVQEALRWIPDDPQSGARLQALEDEPVPAPGQRAAPCVGARILLADDNADMRGYVANLLSASYRIETVSDGQQALEAARRELPDLILSDIMMPRLDGLELLKALRSDESLRQVPVILLSARAGEEARVEGLDAGADDYLVKPFSARELLARVGARLELVRTRFASEQSLRERERALREAHTELERRTAELARFNQAAVGRELRVIELKQEVNELRRRQGESARYSLAPEEQPQPAAAPCEPLGEGLVPLDIILRTDELRNRSSRPADHESEISALTSLVQALADSPRSILQTLADRTLEVLQAGSAGMSLLTRDGRRFYWAAIAGQWAPHSGGGTPRGFG